MKKQIKRLTSVLTAGSMLFGMGAMTASAESDPTILTVIGTKEDSVILSNGCALLQKELEKYGDASIALQCGDVVRVNYTSIEPVDPGRFCMDDDASIEYLGTVNDYYANLRRELTITDIERKGATYTLTDADGMVYTWETWMFSGIKEFGYKAEIDPNTLVPGDVLLCTVEDGSVTYPVQVNALAEAELLGDVIGDGQIGLMDVIALNKSILNIKPLADTKAFLAADMNRDRTIDVYDLALLKREVLTK